MYGFLRVEVPSMEEDSIKDTIGAGDSFIAGFLHSVAYTEEGHTSGLRAAIENGVGRKVCAFFIILELFF